MEAQIENEMDLIEFRKALKQIKDQKDEIESINANLRSKLLDKNDLLKYTNQELIKHDGELRQFSFMVSHNLRAPVAALKGLFNLLEEEDTDRNQVISKMGEVIENLDGLMHDMNRITNIRNEVYQVNEKVDFNAELKKIKRQLFSTIKTKDVVIETDFSQHEFVYSVQSIVNSILFNLVSNGIKYHAKDEAPRIKITSEYADGTIKLKVKDYGLGINLKKNREKLFRLYSRFNPEIDGRGMGLYLSKMQIESLGGKIEVASELGEWTEFTVTFENANDTNKQIFHQNPSATLFYDAELEMHSIAWEDEITFGDYKEVYSHMVALQVQYLPEYWFMDFSRQGHIPVEFHLWMRKNIVPAFDDSLKQIFCVEKEHLGEELEAEVFKTKKSMEKRGIKVHYFDSVEEARSEMMK